MTSAFSMRLSEFSDVVFPIVLLKCVIVHMRSCRAYSSIFCYPFAGIELQYVEMLCFPPEVTVSMLRLNHSTLFSPHITLLCLLWWLSYCALIHWTRFCRYCTSYVACQIAIQVLRLKALVCLRPLILITFMSLRCSVSVPLV